jgi:hypothetical protein
MQSTEETTIQRLEKPDDLPRKYGGPCRTLIWQAMNPDPDYRKGLPFLPCVKTARSRWVATSDYFDWLAKLRTKPIDSAA